MEKNIKHQEIVVNTENEVRIDKFLSEILTDFSRNEIKRFFDEQKVEVNDKLIKPSFKVKNGDIIKIYQMLRDEVTIQKENIPLDVVYEDDDILVVNKPSGMVVHPAPGHLTNTLVNACAFHSNSLSDVNGDIRPGIVHRIDKDTSGLLVVCKNNSAHRFISDQLRAKTSTRIYYAIVRGVIPHNLGRIDAPIGRDLSNRLKQAVVEDGKPAVTKFEVLQRFANTSLVKLVLETGRTHQIRVHMAYIGYPVLGDPLYGDKNQTTPFGQYLHAKTLGFIHPKTKEYVEFDSELPKEFLDKLEELNND